MSASKNLYNFYKTKQASLLDYLKSMGIGAGIGGVGGAGMGVVHDSLSNILGERFSPRSNKFVPNTDNSWFHNYFPNK